jgi:[protein-PII] uridylyltransferase
MYRSPEMCRPRAVAAAAGAPPNLDRLRDDASNGYGLQQRIKLSVPSLASLRIAPLSSTLRSPSPFAHCDDSLPPAKLRAELRQALRTARDAIREDFEAGGDGIVAALQHSELMDALIGRLLELAARRVSQAVAEAHGAPLAVAAVGGYGRAELAPASDLDLLFVTDDRRSADAVQCIEFVLYRLWDLGLRVGHAVRSVDDCIDAACSDWRTAISLLDLRFLCGQRALYDAAADRFKAEIVVGGEPLIDALLCDLARRRIGFHDPKAPDAKNGPGGLRDLQTLRWLAKLGRSHHGGHLQFLSFADGLKQGSAAQLLWSVRAHLHYLTGRAEDRLSEDLQPDVARRMLWDERPERRCATTLMDRFREATDQIAQATSCFVRQ